MGRGGLIRKEVLTAFYEFPKFNQHELNAISASVPYWLAVNLFLNRTKSAGYKLKNGWPAHLTADHELEKRGISWKYKRDTVRFCHIEYSIRYQAATVIFDVDIPRRVSLRRRVKKILKDLEITTTKLTE